MIDTCILRQNPSWRSPLCPPVKYHITCLLGTHTCPAGFVLAAVSVQQQSEDQHQDEDDPHQSHDQQEPPLLVERTLGQRCTQEGGEEEEHVREEYIMDRMWSEHNTHWILNV